MTFDQIKRATAAHFGIFVCDLEGPSRATRFVRPRMLAMWICRYDLMVSLPAIGRAFGGRDHSTVSKAVNRIDHFFANPPAGEDYGQDHHEILEAINQMRREQLSEITRRKQWQFTSTRKVADTVN